MAAQYSIIIPAYNEEVWLAKSIPAAQHAMEAVALPGEIIVVDNNSSDATAAVARSLGAQAIFEPINQISRARNAGAHAASGRYYVFIDADTLVTPELLRAALDALASRRCCGGGAMVHIDSRRGSVSSRLFMLVVRLVQMQKVATGCFVFCRADAFRDIGGFSEKVFATEEYWFSLALKRWGRRHGLPFELLEDQRVVTSGRKFEQRHSFWSMLITIFVPFSIFFRSTCRFWYKRG
jgi:glycosyltransferase involved in cell wall biosynthesis